MLKKKRDCRQTTRRSASHRAFPVRSLRSEPLPHLMSNLEVVSIRLRNELMPRSSDANARTTFASISLPLPLRTTEMIKGQRQNIERRRKQIAVPRCVSKKPKERAWSGVRAQLLVDNEQVACAYERGVYKIRRNFPSSFVPGDLYYICLSFFVSATSGLRCDFNHQLSLPLCPS